MICPRGCGPLATHIEASLLHRVELDVCAVCHGIWFDRYELAALVDVSNVEAFSAESPLLTGDRLARRCPRHINVQMRERNLTIDERRGPRALVLDQCPDCEGLWLDGDELKDMLRLLRDEKSRPFLENPETARMGGLGLWLFMFFTGLPVEQWNPRVRKPVVVWILMTLCVLVFGWQMTSDTLRAFDYGLVPSTLSARNLRPLFTYIFLHGSVLHLLGNLYFLYVFGDNVEDRLGKARFLLLFLISGAAAGLLHSLVLADSAMPVVGASGAISGIMAAYAVLFPRTRIISLILLWRVRWNTRVYLGMWLGLQVISAAMKMPNVAWWAHIGGFVVGIVIAWVFRPARMVHRAR